MRISGLQKGVFFVIFFWVWSAVCANSASTPRGELRVARGGMGEMAFDQSMFLQSANKPHVDAAFDYLLEFKPDGTLGPGLATAWNMSKNDPREWTFDIRSGVKFHDGSMMTAEDVAWSLWRDILDPKALGTAKQNFGPLMESVKFSGNQVIVRTKAPQWDVPMWFGEQGNMWGIVYPKKYVEKVGVDAFREHPIGTGPWKFVNRVMGQSIKFEAFEGHWREVPKFKNLTMMLVPELGTRMALLKTGSLDLVEASATVADELTKSGLGFIEARCTNLSALYPFFQWEAGHPFNDKRVRQAVSLAINREAIVKAIYRGKGGPLTTWPMAAGAFAFPKDLGALSYDPAKARQLLAEAGYPNGFKAVIITYDEAGDMPSLPAQAEAIASYLNAVGIQTEVKLMEWAAMRDTVTAKKRGIPKMNPVSLVLRGTDFRYVSISQILGYYLTGYRHGWVSQPRLDELIHKANSELDMKVAEEKWRDVARMATTEYYHIPTVYANGVFGYHPKTLSAWKTLPGTGRLHRLESAVPAK